MTDDPKSAQAKRRPLTPYQKIVRAAEEGRGVRLTAQEAFDMGHLDDAIFTAAQERACEECQPGKFWLCRHDIDPALLAPGAPGTCGGDGEG
jgi:hypothetical protein